MVLSVASGKGGTGKTTIAVNLAMALSDKKVQLLDCDVEEPNAHLFLQPRMERSHAVSMEVPKIDETKCTYCGQCQDICQFNAIGILPRVALTFQELCHGCGGCFMVCPEGAVMAESRLIGTVEEGRAGKLGFVHGRLRVGEAMAPPLINRVRGYAVPEKLSVVDAPPGTSCPVIAALRGSDYVLLVTEPTPFGLNDLKLAVGAVRTLGLPLGIVINRSDVGDRKVQDYARQEGIPVLLEIPFDRHVAETYARGKILVDALPEWRDMMLGLFRNIQSYGYLQ